MKTLLASLLFLLAFEGDACELSRPVYSLSGPVSLWLRDLNLLRDKNLLGVSIFHPLPPGSAKILPGGVFLSSDQIDGLKGSAVFFDQSRDLERMFRTRGVEGIEVKSRGLTPELVFSQTLSLLRPLLSGCEIKVRTVEMSFEKKLYHLRSVAKAARYFFYLGEIRPPRRPELLMVNDGVVKWLVSNKLLSSYPSELAYVNWSAKVLQTISADFDVGIVDTGNRQMRKIVKRGKTVNLFYPGALIPGEGQVDALIYLFENLP